MLLAVFIYWGWDTAVTVNEEAKDTQAHARSSPPCCPPSCSWLIYVIVSIAAQAFHGPGFLTEQQQR